MATTQHTARVRTSEPFWLIDENQLHLDPKDAKQHTYLMRVSGVSLAMGVIRNLLRHSNAHRRTRIADQVTDATLWPFSPTQVQGLRAALYFLRRHNDEMLKDERNE
ncbi:hypothetical protein [Dyella choica]|uniref:Uncharacterized protein n=1 Tax=Dyella choica TaxID=1927959 RepID=A0A3S0RIS5_9GAMM|nr:hypothetical protein [Dyella choica]RUL72510.1 hypothetical protein EKH80_17695 [Dyella choica]